MTESMVERCARALCRSSYSLGGLYIEERLKRLEDCNWHKHVDGVRAVLETLRDNVNEEMLHAGSETPGMKEVNGMILFCGMRNKDHRLTYADHGGPSPLQEAFVAMLDQALAKTKP